MTNKELSRKQTRGPRASRGQDDVLAVTSTSAIPVLLPS
jgi:hypothetical protein